MNHFTSPDFWKCHRKLSPRVRNLATKNFELLKKNLEHPSLHLKRVRKYWSVRVGLKHRALAVEIEGGLLWFWIGTHAEYDKLVG